MSIAAYEPLVEKLRRDIRRGKYSAGGMLGTEVQLARTAGISRPSVRIAVETLIAEGLVERRPGKGVYVRKPESALIAELIVPRLSGIWAEFAEGAQAVARERGFKAQIFNAHGDFEADLLAIQRLPTTDVDGAIVGSLHQTRLSDTVIGLHHGGFPVVVVDQRLHEVEVPSVVFDDHTAGYCAAKAFLDQGHRHIGFVGYTSGMSLRARLDGLRDAVNDAGVPFDRSLVLEIPAESLAAGRSEEPVVAAITHLLSEPSRPTAILFHDEELAMWGIQAARSLALDVPGDISMAAVGNGRQCQWSQPAISAVDLPAEEMGRVAMEMLLHRISTPDAAIEHRVLPVSWVQRSSIGKAGQRAQDRTS